MNAALLTSVGSDLDRLQGAWVSVLGRQEAILLVAGHHFTVRFGNGKVFVGTFRLDETARPRRMDMAIEHGSTKHVGKTALCIYELDEDALRWCPTEPGTTDRLAGFPTVIDPKYLCLTFERERA